MNVQRVVLLAAVVTAVASRCPDTWAWPTNGRGYARAVAAYPSGDVVVAGSLYGDDPADARALLGAVRLAAAGGAEVWRGTVANPGSHLSGGAAYGVVVDGSGDVL